LRPPRWPASVGINDHIERPLGTRTPVIGCHLRQQNPVTNGAFLMGRVGIEPTTLGLRVAAVGFASFCELSEGGIATENHVERDLPGSGTLVDLPLTLAGLIG
jgi:hypothetical protein